MRWGDIELEKYIVAAMVRDERKVLLLGNEESRTKIRIYTAAGKLISAIEWTHKGLVAMGWTVKENLACVLDDGNVLLYTIHGMLLNQFDMGPACKRDHVAECLIWGSGLVVRTAGRSELYALNDFDAPSPYKLADFVLPKPPTSMAVIPPQLNVSGNPEVLLATTQGSILVVDRKEAQDQLLDNGPFAKMVVSPSGASVACFSDEGTLFVMNTDFSKHIARFGTNSKVPPRDIIWCGEDAVVLYWDTMLLVVGHAGDFIKYRYDHPLFMVTETDGVRVVTSKQCQFLQKVPPATESIFKITRPGASSPAARLFDATEAFESKSVEADGHIRSINKDDLKNAIDQCLTAAAHEFNFKIQRALLKAASYGKLSCESYKADKFVDMCRTLRVLNAVRHVDVGIPLTSEQYSKLEADVLVDRLVNRHQHLLALRICQYLRIPPERVLVHWACAKIKKLDESKERDEEVGNLIIAKLRECPAISYREIATTAFQSGRRTLATQLLDQEPLATVQVPLLLNFKEDELALTKAVESGDTDLVYSAMLQIRDKRPYEEFFAMIRDKAMARNLYISYCKQSDLAALKEFYYTLQRPLDAGNTAVLEAYQCSDWKERLQGLDIGLQLYQKDKAAEFTAQVTDEQLRLLRFQAQAEAENPRMAAVDLSCSELISAYLGSGQVKHAAKVRQLFKVPDNRFWHLEVRAYARTGAWAELAKLCASKKVPPIGFQPFVEACVEHKNYGEAAKYIARLTDPHEQMEWFGNIGFWKEAADVAVREKDLEALQIIRARCRTPAVQQYIDKLMSGGR